MAAGLPCVVLDGKGNRDLIEQGQNGYMIDEQDPSEFAARIQTLTTSPEAYEAMSAYAREYARGFDIGRAADRFVAFYHQCRLQDGSHRTGR
jgi:glycosyltransferase EpsD